MSSLKTICKIDAFLGQAEIQQMDRPFIYFSRLVAGIAFKGQELNQARSDRITDLLSSIYHLKIFQLPWK